MRELRIAISIKMRLNGLENISRRFCRSLIFFFADKRPNTVILIKRIVVEGQNVQLVLRLHVPADQPGYKNSVLSFWNISEERRENYFRNKKVIYKRKET